MYNANQIESFIDKVNKEAEAAAQKVYDKYQKEFETRLMSQIKTGDCIYAGMGTVFIQNRFGSYVGEKLANVLLSNEYNSLSVGLSTPSELKKFKV